MFFSVPSAPRRGTRAVRKAALSLPLIAMSLAGPPAAVASPVPAGEAGASQTSTNKTSANEIGPEQNTINEIGPKEPGTAPSARASVTSSSLSSHIVLLLPEGHDGYVFRHLTHTTMPVNGQTQTTGGQTANHLVAGQGSVKSPASAKPQVSAKAQARTKPTPTPLTVRHVSSNETQPVSPVRIFVGNFLVTCYDLTGHTATGAPVSLQSVAVDPSVIPLGTQIYVPGAGVRTADDTGGLIIGLRLDIWEPTYADCANWGAEEKPVYRITR